MMAPHLSAENRVKFLKIVNKLKKICPTAYPIKIRTVPKKKKKQNYGHIQFIDYDKKKIYFLISLMQTEYEVMVDSLIHEYAHALNWKLIHNEHSEVEFHDESWAVEYSKLYRMFIDPGLENPNVRS